METKLSIIEKYSQRVLTTQQLAYAYGTDDKKIRDNFANNKSRYVEGKHYFRIEGDELRELKHSTEIFGAVRQNANSVYLWTEIGALHHAKSLGTEKAWEVFGELEETYFRVKDFKEFKEGKVFKLPSSYAEALRELAAAIEASENLKSQNFIMQPKAEFYDDVAGSKDAIAISDAAKVLNLGLGPYKLFRFLRDKKVLMQNNIPYQEYIDRGYFRTIEQKFITNKGETKINIKTLVYQKGLDYIRKLLRAN